MLMASADEEGAVDVLEWIGDHGDDLAELATCAVEQGRTLELIGHAYDHKYVFPLIICM